MCELLSPFIYEDLYKIESSTITQRGHLCINNVDLPLDFPVPSQPLGNKISVKIGYNPSGIKPTGVSQ